MIKGLEDKFREFAEDLNIAEPVIITEVYPKRMRVDVRLKTKKEVNNTVYDTPEILDIPVNHHQSKTFTDRLLPEVGDQAWIVFTNRTLDNILEDIDRYPPKFDRILDENDAFLVGEWTREDERIPELGSMSGDDWLLILHRSKNSRIYMRQNGNIVLHPGMTELVELVEDPKYSVPLYELLAMVYNTHTHPIPGTGPPVQQMTSVQKSRRVKVDN